MVLVVAVVVFICLWFCWDACGFVVCGLWFMLVVLLQCRVYGYFAIYLMVLQSLLNRPWSGGGKIDPINVEGLFFF